MDDGAIWKRRRRSDAAAELAAAANVQNKAREKGMMGDGAIWKRRRRQDAAPELASAAKELLAAGHLAEAYAGAGREEVERDDRALEERITRDDHIIGAGGVRADDRRDALSVTPLAKHLRRWHDVDLLDAKFEAHRRRLAAWEFACREGEWKMGQLDEPRLTPELLTVDRVIALLSGGRHAERFKDLLCHLGRRDDERGARVNEHEALGAGERAVNQPVPGAAVGGRDVDVRR